MLSLNLWPTNTETNALPARPRIPNLGYMYPEGTFDNLKVYIYCAVAIN